MTNPDLMNALTTIRKVTTTVPASVTSPHLKRLFGYRELSYLSGRSIKSLERDVARGTGPRVTRIGRLVRFTQEDVASWFEKCARGAEQGAQ
jgi:predicted DNA-binding transcriptional regulator AlpA